MKCKREADGRALGHNELEALRQLAVKAVRSGQTVTGVANAYGLNIRTVFRWLSDYASGGQKALMAKPIPGRPKKVTAEEMRWIAETVRSKTPDQCQFDFMLWTLTLIQALIQRQFGKDLSLSTVRLIMKTLGFSPQRPLYHAIQRDAVLVENWRATEYPKIRAEAQAVNATIYFADEAGMRSDYHAGTTWAPVGETPSVEVTGSRFGINMLSAVSPRGEMRFMLHEGNVTATVFLTFLKRLIQREENPVFVIVDGHPIHKARIVQEFVAKSEERLKIFILPPYSPHLNPDEQVWGNIKPTVAKKGVKQKAGLIEMVHQALRQLQRMPQIIQGFFRHPDCRYIIENP